MNTVPLKTKIAVECPICHKSFVFLKVYEDGDTMIDFANACEHLRVHVNGDGSWISGIVTRGLITAYFLEET